MGYAPQHGQRYRSVDAVPGRAKRFGDFLPRQTLGPCCQEPILGRGHRTLAVRPRYLLHRDPASTAVDAPRSIEEENRHAPKRHKLEAALRQTIVAWTTPPAPRAHGLAVGPRSDLYF